MTDNLQAGHMCRYLIYKGEPMLMADLLMHTEQSLVKQSYKALERREPLNGDGFGVGWYVPEIDEIPAVVTSITPAWSNRSLRSLAEKVRSGAFFAHVRAASPGLPVTELNCHPFQYKNFMWMHNGVIPQFSKVKRALRMMLPDELYNQIKGTTDSEHAFALFLHYLQTIENQNKLGPYALPHLEIAMQQCIGAICELMRVAHIKRAGMFNFAVTDGINVVVTRYASDQSRQPETLYFAEGDRFAVEDKHYQMFPIVGDARAVIIASEPLTGDKRGWMMVPENYMLSITDELHVRLQNLDAPLQ